MRTPITVAVFLLTFLVGFVLGQTLGATNSHVRPDTSVGLGWTDLGYSLSPD